MHINVKLFFIALLLSQVTTVFSKQDEPLRPIFFDIGVMTEKEAKILIEATRESFWDKAIGFDGHSVIRAQNKQERKSIPIPLKEALFISMAGGFVGAATHCDVNAEAWALKFMRSWRHYATEKKIAFAATLMGAAKASVIQKMDSQVCPKERKETYEKVLQYLISAK